MSNSSWSTVTGNLYKGILIQVCCNIAAVIFGWLASANDAAGLFSMQAPSWGFWDFLELAANIGAIYGFWVFFANLKPWKALANENDAKPIGSIYTATMLQIVAIVIGFIPLIGFFGIILNIVAWILLLMAYNNLKVSTTFPATAKDGANKLFLAMIISLVGAILSIIPLIGIIGDILAIAAFFMNLQGWSLIAKSEQPK